MIYRSSGAGGAAGARRRDAATWLVDSSLRVAAALDRAAMSVAMGEQAASHYGEPYGRRAAIASWWGGWREGWAMAHASHDPATCTDPPARDTGVLPTAGGQNDERIQNGVR